MRGAKHARMGSGRRNKDRNLGEVIKDLMLEVEECMIRDIYVLCYVSLYYISPY